MVAIATEKVGERIIGLKIYSHICFTTSGTDGSRFVVTPQELFDYRPPAKDPI